MTTIFFSRRNKQLQATQIFQIENEESYEFLLFKIMLLGCLQTAAQTHRAGNDV